MVTGESSTKGERTGRLGSLGSGLSRLKGDASDEPPTGLLVMGLGFGGSAVDVRGSGGSGESSAFAVEEAKDMLLLGAGLLGGVGKKGTLLAMLLAKLGPKPLLVLFELPESSDPLTKVVPLLLLAVVVVVGVGVVVVVVVVFGGGKGGRGFGRGGSVLLLMGEGLSKAGGGAGSAFEKRDRPAAAASPGLGV